MENKDDINIISEFEFCGKRYVKTYKEENSEFEYEYFEVIDNEKYSLVTDSEILKYFKENFECNLGNIVI